VSRSIRLLGLVAALVVSSLPLPVLAGPAGPAGSAGPATQESPAVFNEAPCPFPLPDDQIEGEDVDCGFLTVPEFYDAPDGPTIELAVAIYRSPSPTPADEPLVMLLGGPGQEVASILMAFSEDSLISYRPLLERQDVIILEQRGIGYSTPSLACPFDAVGGREPEDEVVPSADVVATLSECAEQLRDDPDLDLEAYDTIQNAADVDALREALGYEQIDLYGVSYGSKLALTVMRDFPDSIRSAILASPLPLEANVPAGGIIAFDRALKGVFAACEADPTCGTDHPDLDVAFAQAVERFNDEPVQLTVTDPLTQEQVELTIDGSILISIVYIAVYVGLAIPFVPNMIDAAADGDTGPLELLAPFTVVYAVGVSFGANFVYNCNDEYPFSNADEVVDLVAEAGVMPELATGEFITAYGNFQVCEEFDLRLAPRSENSTVESEIPSLILVGEFDPITPPEYGEQVAAALPNSTLVVFPGLAHDPITTGGDCAMTIATDFLADPVTEPDLACVSDMGLTFFA
jgi:pimeloyl-ACP methyl ester carboxylesterase